MSVVAHPNFEAIFREEFLKSAPLYVAASKVRMPHEDIRLGATVMYRGALHEESRCPVLVSDYRVVEGDPTEEAHIAIVIGLAREAGVVVDGLIRVENCKGLDGTDPRDTAMLRVTNIFEHLDGRSNLLIGQIVSEKEIGWMYYRFHFAAARVRM